MAVWIKLATALVLASSILTACTTAPWAQTPAALPSDHVTALAPTPLLAYYSLQFDQPAWARIQPDVPQLGTYSSDDRTIMRQHMRWAKQAGITGFIVGWANTAALNQRLTRLAETAERAQFKLVVLYENRAAADTPAAAAQAAADFDYLIQRYGHSPVFDLFEHPLIIWPASANLSSTQVAQVTTPRRAQALFLAAERTPAGYNRLAAAVDGNAFYWSAAEPLPDLPPDGLLDTLAQAVHQQHGLWIPPVTPGFDLRQHDTTTYHVNRLNGTTLRQQFASAVQSSPDAIGLISWNGFAERSYLEPSQQYGMHYLHVLASLTQATPQISDFDSSEPAQTQAGFATLVPIAALAALALLSVGAVLWRKRRR